MKNKSNIVPLGDRVLVRPVTEEDLKKSKSGIIIPETVSKERPEQGTVVAIGPGKMNNEGKYLPMSVKIDDKVIFSKYGPEAVKFDGEDYYILSEDQIIAVIK